MFSIVIYNQLWQLKTKFMNSCRRFVGEICEWGRFRETWLWKRLAQNEGASPKWGSVGSYMVCLYIIFCITWKSLLISFWILSLTLKWAVELVALTLLKLVTSFITLWNVIHCIKKILHAWIRESITQIIIHHR